VTRHFLIAATLFLAAAAPAAAQSGSRQSATFAFGETHPGRPTSLRLAIDYVNPADPAAKPPAVQTVLESVAPGARIDTSVPAVCAASDGELMTGGADVCPPGSRVGGGELDLDTGVPGPGRIVPNRVTLLNNTGELILLVEQEGGSRAVARARIDGRTFVAQAPPIPGGPPDGFTAIKRVRVMIDAVTAGGRGYITTPDTCPATGRWQNRLVFTYRDGQTQTVEPTSACTAAPAAAPAPDRSAPRIRVTGLPRGCATRSFTAHVRIRDDSVLRRVRVQLGRRVLRITRRKRFDVRVSVRALRRSRSTLAIAARDRSGNLGRLRIRLSRCAR
jgi:hypothetical protein